MNTSSDFGFPDREDHEPSFPRSSDRTFGLVFTAMWAAIAIAPLRHGGSIRSWAALLGATFLLSSLLGPALLGPLNRRWHKLGRMLEKVTTPLIMGMLFFLTIVPLGFIMRLLKRDALQLKWDRGAASYWMPRQPPGPPPESMRDQF
jgi:Saxitoxin biosynthesis operon protein SxtJ